jgi:hypothetical protein
VGGWIDLSSGRGGTMLILSVPLDHALRPPPEEGSPLGPGSVDAQAWG